MANRERGELTLVAGEREYTLRLTTNACAELEDASGHPFGHHLHLWNTERRVKAFRWLIWAALQDHHGADFKDPKAVGPVIDACDEPELVKLMIAFVKLNTEQLLEHTRGAGKKDKGGVPPPDPSPTQATTNGGDSSLTLVRTA